MKYLFIVLLSGLLAGCAEVAAVLVSSAATSVAIAAVPLPVTDPAPRVLCTTPDTIAVEYGAADAGSDRTAALELIVGHCGEAYTETRSVDRGDRWILEARCGRAERSDTPHCRETL